MKNHAMVINDGYEYDNKRLRIYSGGSSEELKNQT